MRLRFNVVLVTLFAFVPHYAIAARPDAAVPGSDYPILQTIFFSSEVTPPSLGNSENTCDGGFCAAVDCQQITADLAQASAACPASYNILARNQHNSGERNLAVSPSDDCKKILLVCGPLPIERATACCQGNVIYMSEESCNRLGLQSGTYCENCLMGHIDSFDVPSVPDQEQLPLIHNICTLKHENQHCSDLRDNTDVQSCRTESRAFSTQAECLNKYHQRYCNSGDKPFWCNELANDICYNRSLRDANECICEVALPPNRAHLRECSKSCAKENCGDSLTSCLRDFGLPAHPITMVDCRDNVGAYCENQIFNRCTDEMPKKVETCLRTNHGGDGCYDSQDCVDVCASDFIRCLDNGLTVPPAVRESIKRRCQELVDSACAP